MSALAAEATLAESALERLPFQHAPATDRRPRVRLVPAPPPAELPAAVGPALAEVPTLRERIRVLRASDREPVLDAADEVHPTPTVDPAAAGVSIALAAIEALAGRRPVAQLARWLTPGVYESLRTNAALTMRALGAPAGPGRGPVARRRRVCRLGPHAVEVAVVADDGARIRAVALRLETVRGSWRATSLEIG